MLSSLLLFLPELYLFGLALGLLGVILVRPNQELKLSWLPWVTLGTVIVSLACLGLNGTLFWEAYRVDALSQFFKVAVAIGLYVCVQNAMNHPTLDREKRTDYFFFLTLSAWGLMLLASASELVTMFIALEVSSYSLYALVPLRGESREAAESGVKYILFGAAATAVSLYGLSYIMATMHTTYLSELVMNSDILMNSTLAMVGLVMFLAGFFFKLALFPFHFWAPDVYQGASNETTAFIATLPKLGAVVILVRMAVLLKPGLPPTDVMAVLAAVSMTYGNLAALVQKDVKRLLGYSGVAHAGYVMLGLVAGTASGLASAAFYSLVYIFMNLTCFWVICRISGDGKNIELDDLNGLHRSRPMLAFVMAVGAFALVGLPPTAGFMGKLFLLTSVWNQGYNWLVIVAVLNTAISIYYYLNLVRHAYTTEAEEALTTKPGGHILGGLLAAVVLLLGIIPSPLFSLALKAGQALLP